MFPQRATTKNQYLLKPKKYMSILDKTHLKTEIFESKEKLEQSICKVTSRFSIATKWNGYWIASIKLYSDCMVIEFFL